MATNDGGSAFPSDHMDFNVERGMSLRDWFAGQTLTLVAAILHDGDGNPTRERIAAEAYGMADAMLAEREKVGG